MATLTGSVIALGRLANTISIPLIATDRATSLLSLHFAHGTETLTLMLTVKETKTLIEAIQMFCTHPSISHAALHDTDPHSRRRVKASSIEAQDICKLHEKPS